MAVEAAVPVLATSPIVVVLVDLLPLFIVAAGVGIFVAKVGRFPYTIALLLAGLGISVLGAFGIVDLGRINIRLSHDLIFLVLLPPLLFEGAATTEFEQFRRNALPVLALAVGGLVISVGLLGAVGTVAFGFPLLVSLLFAAMVLPTDPVSVLALFEELGAPDRLSVLVEGESLINDGVGVVLFSTFLALVRIDPYDPSALFDPVKLGKLALEVGVESVGGALVGLLFGYAVYIVMRNLDEHMTEIVLTFVLAYGSFLVAQHFLDVSGVIATVVAGLFIGNRGAEYAMSPQTKISIFNSLQTAAFVVNTFIFLMIGVRTPMDSLLAHYWPILIAVPLVLLARATVVYPITAVANLVSEPTVSRSYQHVLVWGGLHGSIPIALVLGLNADQLPDGLVPELRAMVFGVAAFSLVVQGLTMSNLMDRLGVARRSETEELYELLVGRARAVDAALDTAEQLYASGELHREVYEDFSAEYEREKDDLADAIGQLLSEHPDLRREQLLAGERRVLREEKSALMEAVRTGTISDDVGERLLEEVNLKLDRVRAGRSTVGDREEGYEEFWRSHGAEMGLDTALDVSDGGGDGRRDGGTDIEASDG